MYTYDILKNVEAAARAYCKKTGTKPDEMVHMAHPDGLSNVLTERPTWAFVGDQMIDLSLMLQCLQEAHTAKDATSKLVIAP